ncbi:MAG TPA: hypothetical protein VFJ81_07940 [Gemmatimonadales bacterium]|nr:hypothetical protein [Gemmatimonadales bacterium]
MRVVTERQRMGYLAEGGPAQRRPGGTWGGAEAGMPPEPLTA